MTDDAIPAGFVLVPRELTHAMLDATCDTQADDAAMRDRWAALLDAAPKITPAPSFVTGSGERAREVSATLLGEVMQDAWGEICDDADAHPSDMKHGKGTVLFYSPGHWTDLIALRLNERLAALAASRPTDAGAGLLEKLDAIKQAARYVQIGDGYFDLYANAAEAVDAAVDRLAATLATPKPPVDEPWPGYTADQDKRRVVTLAKLGLMLSVMAGGEAAEVTGFDAFDLYADVLIALGIEDTDDPDIALQVARDDPEGHMLTGDGAGA